MSGVLETTSDYATNYKRIQVAGIFGGVRPYGVNAVLYSESMDLEKVLGSVISPNQMRIKRLVECELMIDPVQLKSIYQWLGQQITEYERIFGTIRSPEEIESKRRRDDSQ